MRYLPRLLAIAFISAALLFTPGCACINTILGLLPLHLLYIQNTPDGENYIADSGERVVFSEGLAPVCIEGRWGYIDTKGEWTISPRYESASAFHDGKACVIHLDKAVVIDRTGSIVYEPGHSFTPYAALVAQEE